MSSLKEKIAKAISKHISFDDTYTYELTRDKLAFEVGTISLDDFEEWSEENIDDLADSIVESLQPQLNQNQQIVLGYLKEMMISFDLCNAIYRLESAEDWGHASELYDIAYESLNDKERLQVVQAACQWAQEWEEPV